MSHRLKYLLVLVLSFCLWVPALAQKVSFEAATPAIVSVDEPFRIEFVLNAKPDHFTPPASFGEFEVLAGPSTAQGQSVSIVNGKVTQSVSVTYTYVLQAHKPGKYTISRL
ncbi:MAG: BatD family protein [Alistipes indistinctus]